MIFLGIDPGKAGALVALDGDGTVLTASTVPMIGKEYDDTGMAQLVHRVVGGIRLADVALCGLEKVGTRPGESLRGAFAFGEGVGLWRGILCANGIGWRFATPQAWQRHALRGTTVPRERRALKDAVTASALRRWPSLHEHLRLKKNQGIADAAWIAEHVRLTHKRND